MRNFGIFMVVGSFILFLFAPLWGYTCHNIVKYYEIDYVYGLYLVIMPWVVFYSMASIWLFKLMPKE
jgi:hypothetical protein